MRPLVLLIVVLGACADKAPAPSATAGRPPAPLESPGTGPQDVVVATVNGRAVWGSCVTDQARRGAARDAALQQCISFELLAQAAERRGLALDPEVAHATRVAMVSQLVAHAYEDKLVHKEDFGDEWDSTVKKGKLVYKYKHVEYRASAYIRAAVADKHTPEQEEAARALANEIAAALAPETGLMAPQAFEIATRVAAGRAIETTAVEAYKIGGLEDHYGDALFAIPEIGRASPAIRTKWGWDVIVWTDGEPARDPSPAALEALMLPDVKRAYFSAWVNRIARDLKLHVEVVKDNLARLEGL